MVEDDRDAHRRNGHLQQVERYASSTVALILLQVISLAACFDHHIQVEYFRSEFVPEAGINQRKREL